MWWRIGAWVGLALVAGLAGCGQGARVTGGELSARFQVLENLDYEGAFRSRCRLSLQNGGDAVLPDSGWAIFFNSPPILLSTLPDSVRARHVNGDFYRFEPGDSFDPRGPGESWVVEFATEYALFNESAAPAGFYLVWNPDDESAGAPEPFRAESVEPFTRPEQSLRSPEDLVPVPTAESRFAQNAALSDLSSESLSPILPTPLSWRPTGAALKLDAGTAIRHGAQLESEASYLARALGDLLGREIETAEGGAVDAPSISIRIGPLSIAGVKPGLEAEAYRLKIDAIGGVEIVGGGPAGAFYGIQSLLALVPAEAFRSPRPEIEIPSGVMEDGPRFGYRGMHLDVARNFQTAETVHKLLDVLATLKLNRFHFHLTDDEGWRLPVDSLPELTEVGGRRGHTLDESDRLLPSRGSGPFPDPDLSHGSGSYTREEFLDLLRHAAQLHIEVVPEIDLPGHARAAIKAMQARARRLSRAGEQDAAGQFLLHDPEDRSEYLSVQYFNDNVVNVCQESTYRFFETVVDDLVGLYREAGVPLSAVHVGGDEVPAGVWEKSPACERLVASGRPGVEDFEDLAGYFVRRLQAVLAERGLTTAGWEEIALEDVAPGETAGTDLAESAGAKRAYVWNSVWGWGGEENAYRLANAGVPVVLCNASNLYFDLAYNKDPKEPGQAWAGFVNTRKGFDFAPFDLYSSARMDLLGRPLDPAAYAEAVRLTPSGRENVLGLQGQLWSEVAKGREIMEYLAFPKVLALAERAWAAPPKWEFEPNPATREKLLEADWNRFANTLGRRELPRLDFRFGGVAYRLPPPGAEVREGLLRADVAFPGLAIRFTTDGSEPTPDSALYTGPVAVQGPVKLRTFDTRGRSSRTSTVE